MTFFPPYSNHSSLPLTMYVRTSSLNIQAAPVHGGSLATCFSYSWFFFFSFLTVILVKNMLTSKKKSPHAGAQTKDTFMLEEVKSGQQHYLRVK